MSSLVKLDLSKLQAVADELGIAVSVVERTAYRAINGVASKTMTRARREIVSQVNLSQKYVRDRMELTKAGPGKLRAVIAGRQRNTRLVTYDAKQLTARAKRAKGDTARGIKPGRKQAGVAVSVKAGSGRKVMPGAFLIPLRAGKVDGANGMGVFIRTGSKRNIASVVGQEIYTGAGTAKAGGVESGDIRHLYGPSVDQVLDGVIDTIQPDVQSELEAAVLRQAKFEFAKALKAK